MQVEPADLGIGEEHCAAAVRLQAVLMRIDDDRVAVGDGPPRRRVKSGQAVLASQQGEEAAVRGVDVDADAVAARDREHLGYRVDGAEGGGSRRRDDSADLPPGEQRVELGQIDPAGCVDADGRAGHAEHRAHAAVGVVRFRAVGDAAARMQFSRHEERLEVGDGAAGGQVPEV